jgi:hypothetical protein
VDAKNVKTWKFRNPRNAITMELSVVAFADVIKRTLGKCVNVVINLERIEMTKNGDAGKGILQTSVPKGATASVANVNVREGMIQKK